MRALSISIMVAGVTIFMTQAATSAPNAATDSRIDPNVRAFLAELNKDSSPFWKLPGPQVRGVLTGLQSKTPVDLGRMPTSAALARGGWLRVRSPCGSFARGLAAPNCSESVSCEF